tara:strand:- start:4148 stop:4375 length:228 start_codon:yes stop_codon:yes gene_type:complete
VAKFKNVSPRGALEIPALGGLIVQPGEVFDVPAKLAAAIASPGRFEPVKTAAQTKAEKEAAAAAAKQASAGEGEQ